VLWFGLFGAVAAWSLQELLSYGLVAHACYPDWRPRSLPAVAGLWSITLVVSAVALAWAGTAALASWWARRKTAMSGPDASDRLRFMANGGLLVSGMVLFAVVLNLVALFLVPMC
jgi:hypothetical protein